MDVKINHSRKRLRTVSARLAGDTLVVDAPADIPRERLDEIIENIKARLIKRKLRQELNRGRPLDEIAARLNARYFENRLRIHSVEYATDQNSKFGCCNHRTACIRISHRLSSVPDWVRDYVLVHEMAHLIEPNHGASFWNLVSRYELAERAKGYLMALGLENGEEQDLEDSHEHNE